MKTSTKLGLVVVASLLVIAITAGTAFAVWASGQPDSKAAADSSYGNAKMSRAMNVDSNNSTRQGKQRRGAETNALDGAATALGMTPQDLLNELKGGKTLAQIASDKGVDLNTVIDKILEPLKTRLDTAVANGKITQDQADQRFNDTKQKLTDWANNGGPMPGRCDPSGKGSVQDRSPEVPDKTPPGADMI